ncbi:hypothetical protein SUGI_0213060 [Cryptomeria japonica]|nr:hypothetical protein SUGI_0213060 [Cryptomeria japonica]
MDFAINISIVHPIESPSLGVDDSSSFSSNVVDPLLSSPQVDTTCVQSSFVLVTLPKDFKRSCAAKLVTGTVTLPRDFKRSSDAAKSMELSSPLDFLCPLHMRLPWGWWCGRAMSLHPNLLIWMKMFLGQPSKKEREVFLNWFKTPMPGLRK